MDTKEVRISVEDAITMLEYDYPNTRDDREEPIHWKEGRHIHIGKHVKVVE